MNLFSLTQLPDGAYLFTPVGGGGDWILATGFWADAGVWQDSANWID